MYSSQLLDHFEHPRNSGELPDADAHVRIENPACGDILELAIKMDAGRIADIRFRAKGCVPAMACASAMTELAKGKSATQASSISKDEIVSSRGRIAGGLRARRSVGDRCPPSGAEEARLIYTVFDPSIGWHSSMCQSGVAPARLATNAPTALANLPMRRASQPCSMP